ncbi:MAG TPA: DUF4190 domain-containing protein [Chloroflexota bacterium]|nr:DUF4190 domain-containing protein [Chloroflexota bacterium]
MPDDRIRPDEPAARPDDDRPRRRRREDDDFDDDFDRPRRRRREEDESDATGGLIPYKNGMALGSYYCGVFSLIPCFGLVLAPIALVLGFMGLGHAKKHPTARGQAHAWVGIVLGALVLLGHIGFVIVMLLGGLK